MGGRASKCRGMLVNMGLPCASFSKDSHPTRTISSSAAQIREEIPEKKELSISSTKMICAICLEPLCKGSGDIDSESIFTAQCNHTFHLICISSNVKHGNVTCPICRANWTYLPRTLSQCHNKDPILRILDDSIATSRVNRLSSVHTARYDDDDPIEPDAVPFQPRLSLRIFRVSNFQGVSSYMQKSFYLSARLFHQQATDIVLVASPNGRHLRLLKQAMALVALSLRSVDRLAVVTYSSTSATRALPLRRMTPNGRRTALQVIDRLSYIAEADPVEGIIKGVKILEDRTHLNPSSYILHLSNGPFQSLNLQIPFPVYKFHIGFGYGASCGPVMHEFDEFISKLFGGVIHETQVRIEEEGQTWIRVGELRGGEERRLRVDLNEDAGFVIVGYSYFEGVGAQQHQLRRGEMVVEIVNKSETSVAEREVGNCGGRRSCADQWDYIDPLVARRWAKHLHGKRS